MESRPGGTPSTRPCHQHQVYWWQFLLVVAERLACDPLDAVPVDSAGCDAPSHSQTEAGPAVLIGRGQDREVGVSHSLRA